MKKILLGAACAIVVGCGGNNNNNDPVCGNNTVEAGETCDDGNTQDGDGCSADCSTIEACGDGIVQAGLGEACDDGAQNSDDTPNACRTDCSLPACGDNVQDTGEACDDGNNVDADGCEANCTLPACNNGVVDPGEICFGAAQLTSSTATNPIVDGAASVGDFNGNGDQDILFLGEAGEFDIFSPLFNLMVGNGTGSFTATNLQPLINDFVGGPIAVDLNSDGRDDLIAVTSGATHFSLSNANGPTPLQPFVFFAPIFNGNPSIADVDEDGDIDVLIAAGQGTAVFLNNGAGSFTQSTTILASAGSRSIVDIDNDGTLDLIGLAINPNNNQLSILVQRDAFSPFLNFAPIFLAVDSNTLSMNVADIDGDGDVDLASVSANADRLSVFLTSIVNGAPQFNEILATVPDRLFVKVADLNNDGRDDLVLGGGDIQVVTFTNGTLSAPTTIPVGSFPINIEIADVNEDGVLDLVTGGDRGVRVLLATP